MNKIDEKMIGELRDFVAKDKGVVHRHASVAHSELVDVAFLPLTAARLQQPFEIEVETHGITSQERSGRCWMYAVQNILREKVIENCGMKEFRLSGNYLAFYDKLEKSANMMSMAIAHANEDVNARINEYMFNGIGDGGFWEMAVDLVRKYGVVPQSIMPETYQSEHTEQFMKLLNKLLRKNCMALRKAVQSGEDAEAMKQEMLKEIYRMECIAFGEPPVSFDFSYRDAENVFHIDRGITPRMFFEKYIGIDMADYCTLINEPTDRRPLGKLYRFHYIGSMQESNITMLNIPMEELKEACLRQLKDGKPVWFGCDSRSFGSRSHGVWDPDSFAYSELFEADLEDGKKERLESRGSFASHAMILVGVNFDENGKPERWKIENSWGEDVGDKGYFVCSDKYFDDYVYEAIIQKQYLAPKHLALLAQEPETLCPWEI